MAENWWVIAWSVRYGQELVDNSLNLFLPSKNISYILQLFRIWVMMNRWGQAGCGVRIKVWGVIMRGADEQVGPGFRQPFIQWIMPSAVKISIGCYTLPLIEMIVIFDNFYRQLSLYRVRCFIFCWLWAIIFNSFLLYLSTTFYNFQLNNKMLKQFIDCVSRWGNEKDA